MLKNSMIRSLYRESERIVSSNDVSIVEKLRKQASRAESKANRVDRKYYDLCKKMSFKYGENWKDAL